MISGAFPPYFCDECRWDYIPTTDEVAGSSPAGSIFLGP